jgi:hypothetical protein
METLAEVERYLMEDLPAAGTAFMAERAGGGRGPPGHRLARAYEVPLAGKHTVVVGRRPILGKPVGMLHSSLRYPAVWGR